MRFSSINIVKILFLSQILFFAIDYLAGSKGIRYVFSQEDELNQLSKLKAGCLKDIENLKIELDLWKNDNFIKEKYCREKLHMAKNKELIYFL